MAHYREETTNAVRKLIIYHHKRGKSVRNIAELVNIVKKELKSVLVEKWREIEEWKVIEFITIQTPYPEWRALSNCKIQILSINKGIVH